jgi:hypothetical protein
LAAHLSQTAAMPPQLLQCILATFRHLMHALSLQFQQLKVHLMHATDPQSTQSNDGVWDVYVFVQT